MKNLTVIIPFYNEEKFLEASINRVLKSQVADFLILVDDCSTDNSLNIAIEKTKNLKSVSIIKSHMNQGKGNALNLAKKYIKTTHVVIHDAGLEYFPDDIVKMIEKAKLSPNSLILGSRFIGVLKRDNIYKRTYFANKIMSLFFSILHLYRVSDIATCYKLMPVSFFKKTDLKEKGFAIEVELVAKFLKFNRSIIEIPIRYAGRSYEEGKKIKAFDGFNYILKTFKYKLFR